MCKHVFHESARFVACWRTAFLSETSRNVPSRNAPGSVCYMYLMIISERCLRSKLASMHAKIRVIWLCLPNEGSFAEACLGLRHEPYLWRNHYIKEKAVTEKYKGMQEGLAHKQTPLVACNPMLARGCMNVQCRHSGSHLVVTHILVRT